MAGNDDQRNHREERGDDQAGDEGWACGSAVARRAGDNGGNHKKVAILTHAEGTGNPSLPPLRI